MLNLKMMGSQQETTVNHQTTTKENDENGMKESSIVMDPRAIDDIRNKRPARLLPLIYLYGERKNETEVPRFYGPPTNCTELSQLGYTLNGYYLVKNSNDSNKNAAVSLDTVFCAFKQPQGIIGLSKIETRIIVKGKLVESSQQGEKLVGAGSTSNSGAIHFHVESRGRTGSEGDEKDKFGVQFEIMHLNLGNAFDVKAGMFTASNTGVYRFFFTAEISSTLGPYSIDFYHNTKIFRSTWVQNQVRPLIEVTIKLKKEDDIHLKVNRAEIQNL